MDLLLLLLEYLLLLDSAPPGGLWWLCFWCSVLVDTVFEDVLVVVVDDIDIPDGAEEDLLSEVVDLFVAVVVVGVVAESDDDAGKVEEIKIF